MQTDGLKQQQVARKLNVSLQQSIERGDKKNELAGYKYLSEYYAVNKQFERALEYNRKYHEGSAAVGNNDLQLEIKKLESQYNLEKKEQEIALLKKDQQLQKLGMQRQKTFQYSAVVLLCLLAFIAFLVINRYRVVQQSKRLMEIEGVRNTIARDLHDDMGSVLSSIHINSKMALENAESPGQVNEHLKKIRENSGYMLESMNDIVWAINPANDTLEKVIIHMKEFAADILEPKDIRYEFVIDDDLNSEKLNPKQRKDFYLIYKEAINNAAKYSHCKRVIVKLSKVENNIMLQVTDDGAGFNSQTIKRGNGLINMAHRAKQMNGEIKISSAINHGTTVTLHTISPA
jgi:signal transduction histidine kinase